MKPRSQRGKSWRYPASPDHLWGRRTSRRTSGAGKASCRWRRPWPGWARTVRRASDSFRRKSEGTRSPGKKDDTNPNDGSPPQGFVQLRQPLHRWEKYQVLLTSCTYLLKLDRFEKREKKFVECLTTQFYAEQNVHFNTILSYVTDKGLFWQEV